MMAEASPDAARGTRTDLPTEPHMATATSDRAVDGFELTVLGIGLLLLPALTLLREYWPVRLVALAVVLVVPGVLLLRVLRYSGRPLGVLAVPSSLVVLMFTGLAVTLLGPVLGVVRPLRPLPQLVGIELVGLVLLGVLAYRARGQREWTAGPLVSRLPSPLAALPSPLAALPLLLPVIAVVGAQRLNSGHDAVLAVLAVILGVLALGFAVVRAPRLGDGTVATILFSVGLASLWSFNLRTEVVYGYDVATEYRKMVEASTTGGWRLLHLNDAYGAMLSITVLPAQWQQVTGMSLQSLVQFVYPGLFALVPLIVFFTARRFMDRRWALVGAAVLVVQSNFGQQMPGLAKQEIGFLLFASVLFVLVTTQRLDPRGFATLVLLSAGVVVSHYSTAYLTVMIFGVAVVIVGTAAVRRPELRRRAVALVVSLVVVAGGAGLWNGVLTRSMSNVGNVVSDLASDGFSLLPNQGGSSLLTYVVGTVTPELPAAEYQQLVQDKYAEDRQYIVPFADGADPANAIRDAVTPPDPGLVDGARIASFVLRQILYLAALTGALALLLFRFPGRVSRDSMWMVGGLGVACVAVLGLIRVSGTLAASYNQDRALLHALIVLAVGIGWSGQVLAKSRFLSRFRIGVVALPAGVAVVLAVQMAVSSSLAGLTSDAAGINISARGEDQKRFYVSRAEAMAGTWLGDRTTGDQGLIYADRYGSLRLLLVAGRYRGVLTEMVPSVIDRNAWIYVSTTNLLDDTARSETDGKYALYRFPDRFLSEHFDTVYSNGESVIMHR